MSLDPQLKLEDVSDDYKAFLDKFKPKKTTDDCYTPPNVYEAVLGWVVSEYGIDPDNVVRPFWPGGDYERFDYPPGCTVVDNPPFSIISRICRTYMARGIKFFLFAPYLTNFSTSVRGLCHVICDARIMYENGAEVDTAFLTNLDGQYKARTAPELNRIITDADRANRKKLVRELPKYKYPNEVVTAPMFGYMSKYGIDFRLRAEDCYFIRALSSQRAAGKSIFGAGFLLSEKAAAEKAAAEKAAAEKAAATVWRLSEDEWCIVHSLGKRGET